MPKTRRNLLLNFYLPCAVSGLLLAGLISFTTPSPEMAEGAAPGAVVTVAAR